MANHGFNLATRSDAEKLAVFADLHAWRIMHQKGKRKDWREWAHSEIRNLSAPLQQPVKDKLNSILSSKPA